jgi:hypothetical protein
MASPASRRATAVAVSRRAPKLATVCCVLALAGCGGSESSDVTEATTAGTTTPITSSSSGDADSAATERAEAIKRQRARARARARAVAGVVRAYYTNLDEKRLGAAWARLSPAVRAELGGYDSWAAGQEGTVDVTVTSVHTEQATKSSASVAVALRSTSVDICSRTVHQRFAGMWTLSRTGGHWVATDLHIEKTGGGSERTHYTDCDDSGSTATTPGSSSPGEPDYAPVEPTDPPPYPQDEPDFCDSHDCIPNFDNGNGSIVQCADGTYSHSGGIQGACSHHGGVG